MTQGQGDLFRFRLSVSVSEKKRENKEDSGRGTAMLPLDVLYVRANIVPKCLALAGD